MLDADDLMDAACKISGILGSTNQPPPQMQPPQEGEPQEGEPQQKARQRRPAQPGSEMVSVRGLGQVPSLSIELPPPQLFGSRTSRVIPQPQPWVANNFNNPDNVNSSRREYGAHVGQEVDGAPLLQVIYVPQEENYYYKKQPEGVC